MSRSWRPPWRPGAPRERCTACHRECIAETLLEDGRCPQCHLDQREPPAAPTPVAEPTPDVGERHPVQESLFDAAML